MNHLNKTLVVTEIMRDFFKKLSEAQIPRHVAQAASSGLISVIWDIPGTLENFDIIYTELMKLKIKLDETETTS